MLSLLHWAIFTPFLSAIAVPFLYKLLKRIHTGWFVLAVPFVLFLYFSGHYPLAEGSIIRTAPWIPSMDIHFTVHLDSLSLLFALLITGIGFLVVLYSIFYLSKEHEALHNFYVYLLCFMGAMLGVVLSDHLLVLYMFWELTSISSFLLIAYWYQRKRSRFGATKALLITVFGGFSMLLGFIMVYAATGSMSIREIIAMSDSFAEHSLFLPAMILILLGAFTKSAQFPFHIWLPDAMEAPTPISAYLHSATMVKAGIYLVARLMPVFGGHPLWFWATVIIGILTLFWASFVAIKQVDLKAMLAYSTVSQLGLIMSLLGIGSLALYPNLPHASVQLFSSALLAGLFHLINHSVFKGTLFMVVGILDHELGTRDIRKLGGLMTFMPVSFTLMFIGSFSMAGLPPFSGFLSKEMFFASTLSAVQEIGWWVVWVPVLAWVASLFTFIYSMILVFQTFAGEYKPNLLDKPPHEAPVGILIPPIVLASLVVLFFFFPNVLAQGFFEPYLYSVLSDALAPGETLPVAIAHWHGFSGELFMTIGIVLAGTFLYRRMSKWIGIYEVLPQKFNLNRLFEQTINGLEKAGQNITKAYMTGNLRDYLSYILGTLIILVGGSLLYLGSIKFDFSNNAEIHLYELAIGLAIVVSAVFMLFSKSRLTSIAALSAVGLMIALYYVIFRAPDLALTQLVVETISTAMFLLCFYFLPKLKKEVARIPFKLSNLLISIGVGLTVTLTGLSALGHRWFEPIASFYEDSYELAGGKNIVNTILVDFRGFDTMLEIVVLFSAGIGIYTMIKFRASRRDQQ